MLENKVRSVLVLVLVLVTAPFVGVMSVPAQDATPAPAAIVPTQIDLAAMTLTPSDLEGLGMPGFGLANQSSLRDAAAEATLQAGGVNIDAAAQLAAFREAGFRYRYVCSLLLPILPLTQLPNGLIVAHQRVSTSVTEYQTADGASRGLAMSFQDAQSSDRLTRTYGDASLVSRSSGLEAETGNPYQRLELAFQVDNLVGSVIIVDFTNDEPQVGVAERLAERLLEKMDQGRQQQIAALSPRVLRVAPLATWIERGRLRDFYVRVDNASEPMFAEIVAALRSDLATPRATPVAATSATGPQFTYMFWTPVGDGDPARIPLYVSWLDQYADERQAVAALQAVTTDLGPGYSDVRELPAAVGSIGYDSRAFSYQYSAGSQAVRGYVVIARVGNIVIRIQADSPSDIRLDGIKALAVLQAACLQELAACRPVEALQVLTVLIPEPGAS